MAHGDNANAVAIACGGVNVVTGQPWTGNLRDDQQDCLVVPGTTLAGRLQAGMRITSASSWLRRSESLTRWQNSLVRQV